MNPFVAFRVSRRALAVVVVDDDDVVFADCRYLTHQRERALDSARKFVTATMTRFHPGVVALYAPSSEGSLADEIRMLVLAAAQDAQVPVHTVNRSSVLSSLAITPLRNREELTHTILDMWQGLGGLKKHIQHLVADAVAAAWLSQVACALSGTP